MQVWIVIAGEQCEASSIQGVYADYPSALEVATRLADPENPSRTFPGRPTETKFRNGDNEVARMEWACDYVSVEVWDVSKFRK